MLMRLAMLAWIVIAACAGPLRAEPLADDVRRILIIEEKALLSRLEADALAALASEVAAFPLPGEIATPGFEWASGADGEWPAPVIRSRDWAFARTGLSLTLAGALGEGQAELMDLGFWCFLEAALIAPDEPQHLVNVAFHLNESGRHGAAITVLEYALSLDPELPGAMNNLAYAQAGTDDYDAAIRSMFAELADGFAPVYARERLARYYDLAGLPDAAQAYRDTIGLGYFVAYEPPLTSNSGKALERALKTLLYDGYRPLEAALNARFPYTGTPWFPDWVMTPEERRYYDSACQGGTCSKPGGFNIGHYLLSDTFQYHCYRRQSECLPPQTSQEACIAVVCDQCVIRPATRWVEYEWAARSDTIAIEMRRLQFARTWFGDLRGQGHELIDAASGDVPEAELRALRAYWDIALEATLGAYESNAEMAIETPRLTLGELIMSRSDLRDCVSGAAQEAGRRADQEARRREAEFQSWLARQPRGLCRFGICKNWSLPLGPIGIEINPRTLKVEKIDATLGLSLGRFFSAGFKFGWNLRKDEPVLGLGILVPVAGYSSAGIGIGWSPSSGLEGNVETGGNLAGPENALPLKASYRYPVLTN